MAPPSVMPRRQFSNPSANDSQPFLKRLRLDDSDLSNDTYSLASHSDRTDTPPSTLEPSTSGHGSRWLDICINGDASFAADDPAGAVHNQHRGSPEATEQVVVAELPPSIANPHEDHGEEDVCLGLLEGGTLYPTASVRATLPPQRLSAKLMPFGGGIYATTTEQNSYLGLLASDLATKLSEVLLNPGLQSLRTEAFLTASSGRKSQTSAAGRSLEILVYASQSQADDVGHLLASRSLYLQHPPHIVDTRSRYFNPQYFLSPDEPFPTLDSIHKVLADEGVFTNAASLSQASEATRTLFSFAQGPQEWTHRRQSSRIKTPLQEHQAKALAMMLEKEDGLKENPEFISLWRHVGRISQTQSVYRNVVNGIEKENPQVPLGGLLADDMGLGKTLSTISLIAASLDLTEQSALDDKDKATGTEIDSLGISKTLIVSPKATLTSWDHEFRQHVKSDAIKKCDYVGRSRDGLLAVIKDSHVVVTTYGILEKEFSQSRGLDDSVSPLFATQWFRVIFDEAHVLRNDTTKVFEAATSLRAERVWCLSGTPIQNYIEDLGSLLQVLRVIPFNNPGSFAFEFGQLAKSRDERVLYKMQRLISALGLRRTKEILSLPTKTEAIKTIQLSLDERKLYDDFCSRLQTTIDELLATEVKPNSYANVMKHILRLRQICNHGPDLLPQELIMTMKRSIAFAVTNDNAECEMCGNKVKDDFQDFDCMHLTCKQCYTKAQREQPELTGSCPLCSRSANDVSQSSSTTTTNARSKPSKSTKASNNPTQPAGPALNRTFHTFNPSSKVTELVRNLVAEQKQQNPDGTPVKSVVFSEWTTMLDLVGHTLHKHRLTHTRIDGSMKVTAWKQSLHTFNTDPATRVLLASVKNAGMGIDLRAATRAHLLEPQWNPMVEEQAFDRIHRLGQRSPVVVYRYVVRDSIEEYVRQIQQNKLELIRASLDAHRKGGGGKLTMKEKLRDLKEFFTTTATHKEEEEATRTDGGNEDRVDGG